MTTHKTPLNPKPPEHGVEVGAKLDWPKGPEKRPPQPRSTIPWWAIASICVSSLALIMLDTNISYMDMVFTLSDDFAFLGLAMAILSLIRREGFISIAIIGVVLSLFVILSVSIMTA